MSDEDKRNVFRRDPKTHQLVATKDTQIPLRHDGLGVEYIIELEALEGQRQIKVHYAFDPERELTPDEEAIIVEDTKALLNDMFQENIE